MYLGTQVKPRDDSDYRIWAQLGVRHLCVDPPGDPHHWQLGDLLRHKERVESFGLTLDMVQLPMSSRPIEEQESPNVMLGKDPERQRELDSICRLIERLGAAGIPAAKYNLSIIGVVRTEREPGRGGSRNAAFRWRRVDPREPPSQAGIVSEEAMWERIDTFLAFFAFHLGYGRAAHAGDLQQRQVRGDRADVAGPALALDLAQQDGLRR